VLAGVTSCRPRLAKTTHLAVNVGAEFRTCLKVISEPVSDGSGSVPNTSQMNCDATDNELR